MTPNSAPLNLDDDPAVNGTLIKSNNYINSASYHKLHNMNVAFQLMEDAGIQVSTRFLIETFSAKIEKNLSIVLTPFVFYS